jgi:hypothetical protein
VKATNLSLAINEGPAISAAELARASQPLDIDTLVAGIHNQTSTILKSAGLVIAMCAVPGWQEYQSWRRAKYGGGFFGRLWCQYIRPWLCPVEQSFIDWMLEKTGSAFRQNFMNTIIERGSECQTLS